MDIGLETALTLAKLRASALSSAYRRVKQFAGKRINLEHGEGIKGPVELLNCLDRRWTTVAMAFVGVT